MADYFRKYKSLHSTTLSSSISTGTGETITFASVTNVPTDTEITVTIGRVDGSGTATPTLMERITGTLSGSNLVSYTRGVDNSTEQAHAAGKVVEMVWNAADWNSAVTGILLGHTQTGRLKNETWYAADSVGTDSYAVTLSPALASLTTGFMLNFKAGTANTGAATLAVNGLTAKTIKKLNDQDLATGDIESGQIVTVVYDGTNWQMQSQLASSAGAAGSTTELQRNNAGAFGGITGATSDGTSVTFGSANLLATRPKITTSIDDSSGNEVIKTPATASAVNEITVTNAATGASPVISATGGDTNIHLSVIGKGNGLTKMSVLDQSDTTNAYKHTTVMLTGWGFILGDVSPDITEAVTFGITATSVLSVTISPIGYKDTTDPTAITDFSAGYYALSASAQAITTGGFQAVIVETNNTNLANTRRFGYSWQAVCTLT